MTHEDHIALLIGGIQEQGGVWADLGSGTGAFTLALANLIRSQGTIYSVDSDQRALHDQERAMQSRFPDVAVHYIQADYTRQLTLPPLDGIIMANSLHFQRNKEQVIRQLRSYLKENGHFILVEYNSDRGNPWVPYPLSYTTWEKLARLAGFTKTQLLATIPSRFLGEIYSALSIQADQPVHTT